jgi:hypothetical protein
LEDAKSASPADGYRVLGGGHLGVALAITVSGAFTGTHQIETIHGSNNQDKIAGGGSDGIDAKDAGDEL